MAIPTMSVKEAKDKLDNDKNFFLLDVREDNEFEFVHVNGANHIKMGEVQNRLSEIPKDKEIGVMCLSGGRSGRITNYLVQQGYQAINIEGGISRYSSEVDPSLPRYRHFQGQVQPVK